MGRGGGVSKSNPLHGAVFVGTGGLKGARQGKSLRVLHRSGRQRSQGLELR